MTYNDSVWGCQATQSQRGGIWTYNWRWTLRAPWPPPHGNKRRNAGAPKEMSEGAPVDHAPSQFGVGRMMAQKPSALQIRSCRLRQLHLHAIVTLISGSSLYLIGWIARAREVTRGKHSALCGTRHIMERSTWHMFHIELRSAVCGTPHQAEQWCARRRASGPQSSTTPWWRWRHST